MSFGMLHRELFRGAEILSGCVGDVFALCPHFVEYKLFCRVLSRIDNARYPQGVRAEDVAATRQDYGDVTSKD